MTAHRLPPLLSGTERAGPGHCKWCGGPIFFPEGHKKAGQINTRRSWHYGDGDGGRCYHYYCIAARSDYMREEVLRRDRGICAKCGIDADRPLKWVKEYGLSWAYDDLWLPGDGPRWRQHRDALREFTPQGNYQPIRPISAWQADHIFPLHLVDRSLPRHEILHYWGLDNIQTLCLINRCHQEKSAEEAAARAKGNRTRLKQKGGYGHKRKFIKQPGGKVVRNPNAKQEVPF